jgi:hypothetical protein
MRPRDAAAQRQDRGLHGEGFIGAEAEFTAGIGDTPRAIGQRKRVCSRDDTFRLGRQFERRELARCVRREADPADHGRYEAATALDTARPGIGVEPCAQAIDAGNGDVRSVVMSCQP